MQSNTFVDVVASVAAVAAAGGLLYARASVRAARLAADTARRTVEVAERSRQAADRARLRRRVERVGELVQSLAAAPQAATGAGELSQSTKSQCRVLTRALIGLSHVLPRSADLALATSSNELSDRAGRAGLEVDAVLKKLARHRRLSVYLPRQQVPWSRPARPRSASGAGTGDHRRITRLPAP